MHAVAFIGTIHGVRTGLVWGAYFSGVNRSLFEAAASSAADGRGKGGRDSFDELPLSAYRSEILWPWKGCCQTKHQGSYINFSERSKMGKLF